MKIFTDGSVSENEQAGAGFVIPELKKKKKKRKKKKKKKKQLLLRKAKISVYCRTTCTIISYIVNLSMVLFNILFCVDSKAVLYSLNSTDSKVRSDIIHEIKHLVHCLLIKGTGVILCWIPSTVD